MELGGVGFVGHSKISREKRVFLSSTSCGLFSFGRQAPWSTFRGAYLGHWSFLVPVRFFGGPGVSLGSVVPSFFAVVWNLLVVFFQQHPAVNYRLNIYPCTKRD